MSTIAYAKLTNRRDAAAPGTSTTQGQPGVGSYVDALAALVPAEVLTVHAVILTFTTTTQDKTTKITAEGTLQWSFFGLIALCVVFYLAGRGKNVDRYDWVRGAIPAVAFVAWTMLQKATAFDAINAGLGDAPRMAIGIFVAVILSIITVMLAAMADQKQLPS